MNGWAALLLLAAASLLLLVWRAKPGAALLQLFAAAVLLAFAGYAWQGRPGLPGRPTPAAAAAATGPGLFATERKAWLERLGPEAQLLDAADTFIARGDADYAAGILGGALSRAPNNATLWIGLGNALVRYAHGAVTPAARYAFSRAAALAPNSPASPYLMGVALAESGDLTGAEERWRAALAAPELDAPHRAILDQRLRLIAALRRQEPDRS